MVDRKFYIIAILLSLGAILAFAYSAFAQPRDGGGRRDRGLEWFNRFDANKNGTIEPEEYKTATDEFFKKLDRNADASIDDMERPRRPQPPPRPEQFPPDREAVRDEPPPAPFFVMESLRPPGGVARAEYEDNVNEQFRLMDKNGDRLVSREEARLRLDEIRQQLQNESQPQEIQPLNSPTAQFIAAELRFGDKQLRDAPFSAGIVIENTRRLFDGSTVTKTSKGAVYRDRLGRTRREQPLENIGSFTVVGENGAPQMLVFINDFPGKAHYFLDLNRRVARQKPLPENRPFLPPTEPKDGKTESLGTKTLEGLTVEGTRTTFEIPAGQLGNDKPIAVTTEKWFSPELQVVVLSRHVDPIAGEHIFRLVNIKKGEPAADLFVVPGDFKKVN
jgi:Ca2+-binding EF-hand superfamily protein